MSATKKPLTFDIQRSPATPTENAPAQQKAKPAEDPRLQVGARIRASTYRQLKARAALAGATVQELVEQAINEFLENHPA